MSSHVKLGRLVYLIYYLQAYLSFETYLKHILVKYSTLIRDVYTN